MKAIRKVEVVPLDYNEGKIINSASTTDDKTKNTYSMYTIDEFLNNKANSHHTHAKSDITDFSHTHDERYYTETEIDDFLNDYKLNGDFALLTHTFNDVGFIDINYPTGFTQSNCVVIGLMSANMAIVGNYSQSGYVSVQLGANNITIANTSGATTVKFVLMKIS